MREIKFRAWHIGNKEMYTEFSLASDGSCIDGRKGYWQAGEYYGTDIDKVWQTGEVEIMQYTGLKDKNDKEIYEGDIVINTDFPKNPCKVVYELEKPSEDREFNDPIFGGKVNLNGFISNIGGFVFKPLTDKHKSMYIQNIEIIGNIYEYPSLLDNANPQA